MKDKDKNSENLFGEFKKGHPFRVPEGYFETFADRLKVRIMEEEYSTRRRSLFTYLKPAFAVAATLAMIMLLVNIPYTKFAPLEKEYITQQRDNNDATDSTGTIQSNLISYFSDDQLISAMADMDDLESKTISTENLADYIAANYNDYEIIANN